MTMTESFTDPHAQLRALYMALLQDQHRFDEFKELLALYEPPDAPEPAGEGPGAAEIRTKLNARISTWIGQPFSGLSPAQLLQWRTLAVEDRINVSLSPWKESNNY